MYVLYVYLFLKNAKLQPSTSKTVPSLFVFHIFCILWPQTQRLLYVHMGVMMPWLFTTVGGGVTGVGGVGGVWKCQHGTYACGYVSIFFFFCQFCILKLDNCTVLMTSSNMLSINVTKSNLDIKCVHEWYTPSMLFHCLCVWTRVFFACVCLKNIARWFNSWRLFLTAVNVKEARLNLFWLPTRCIL